MEQMERKSPLSDLMRTAMEKVHEMVDTKSFGGGSGAGVKIDPVAFLVIKDGVTRVMPVAVPPISTVDRVIDLVPEVMDRVENYLDKKKGTETL